MNLAKRRSLKVAQAFKQAEVKPFYAVAEAMHLAKAQNASLREALNKKPKHTLVEVLRYLLNENNNGLINIVAESLYRLNIVNGHDCEINYKKEAKQLLGLE